MVWAHYNVHLSLSCSGLLKQRHARSTRTQDHIHIHIHILVSFGLACSALLCALLCSARSPSTHTRLQPRTDNPSLSHLHPSHLLLSSFLPSIVDDDDDDDLLSSPLHPSSTSSVLMLPQVCIFHSTETESLLPFLPYRILGKLNPSTIRLSIPIADFFVLHGRPNPYRPNLPSPIKGIELLALSST
jgi:hypothetical protein